MVKKKKKLMIFQKKPFLIVFISLVLVILFLVLFYSNKFILAGQATLSPKLVGVEVYIRNNFDGYLCEWDSYSNVCLDQNDEKGTKWILESAESGKYYLKHVTSQRYLYAEKGEAGQKEKKKVYFYETKTEEDATKSAKWIIIPDGPGPKYYLLQSEFGQHLLVRKVDWTKLELHTKTYPFGSSNDYTQSWQIVPVPVSSSPLAEAQSQCQAQSVFDYVVKVTVVGKEHNLFCAWKDNNPQLVSCNSEIKGGALKVTTGLLPVQYGFSYLPTRYKHYFCTASGLWRMCEFGSDGTHISSEFLAQLGDKQGEYTCAYDGWLTATELAALPKDSSGSLCTTVGINTQKMSQFCDGKSWINCTQEDKAVLSVDGQYTCNGKEWTKDATLSATASYETKMVKAKDEKGIVKKSVVYSEKSTVLKDVYLCDAQTADVSDKATLCSSLEGGFIFTATVDSLNLLNAANNKPYASLSGIVLVYDSSQSPKTVSVINVVDLGKDVSLLLGTFSSNLIGGQRLAVLLNGEYYLLSHPKAELLDFNKLILMHIPTGETFSVVETLGANYQFDVYGGTKTGGIVTVSSVVDKVVLSSAKPKEAAKSYAISNDLKENYEIPFSQTKPIKLADLKGTQVTVCSDDSLIETHQVSLCQDNKVILALKREVLTKYALEKDGQKRNVTFLYQLTGPVESQKKQVYIFSLEALSAVSSPLQPKSFSTNMVAARRLAVEFQGNLYLLEHPKTQSLSLPIMALVSYGEKGTKNYSAKGTETRVDFQLPNGKVVLEQQYGTPTPPYLIKGLTKQQIAEIPVDLEKDLSVSFSSEAPVKIVKPNVGIVSKSGDKLEKVLDYFFVRLEKVNKESLLALGKPEILMYDNLSFVLYYYNYTKMASSDGSPLKSAKAYLLYDINTGKKSHVLNDAFIDTFTSGSGFAVQFGGSFYVVGYAGEKGLVTPKGLTLALINSTSSLSSVTTASSATFTIPEGEITITLDSIGGKLFVSGKTEKELETKVVTVGDYESTISDDASLSVGGIVCSLADTVDTAINPDLALIKCGETTYLLEKDVPQKAGFALKEGGTLSSFLFWYKGKVAGHKLISVLEITTIGSESVQLGGWADLLAKAKDAKRKTLFWQGHYFELVGQQSLGKFTLQALPEGPLPGGEIYPLQSLKEIKTVIGKATIGENGTFVFKENLLFAEQKLDPLTNKATLVLKPLVQKLVTSQGFNLSGETSFTSQVNGPIYSVLPEQKSKTQMKLTMLYNNNLFFTAFLPEGKTMKTVLPDGSLITLKAENVSTGVVKVSQ